MRSPGSSSEYSATDLPRAIQARFDADAINRDPGLRLAVCGSQARHQLTRVSLDQLVLIHERPACPARRAAATRRSTEPAAVWGEPATTLIHYAPGAGWALELTWVSILFDQPVRRARRAARRQLAPRIRRSSLIPPRWPACARGARLRDRGIAEATLDVPECAEETLLEHAAPSGSEGPRIGARWRSPCSKRREPLLRRGGHGTAFRACAA